MNLTIFLIEAVFMFSYHPIDKDTLPKEIKFTPDYKVGEPIFWHAFKELSKNNNESVTYDRLQERLISTGKYAKAVLMTDHMEKIGKIEKTEQYNAYRIGKSNEEELDNM